MKIAPGYALLKPVEMTTSGALTLSSREVNRCTVIAIGEPGLGEYNGQPSHAFFKVGDDVFHTTIGYEDINVNGEAHRITKFTNILAVYEK